MIQWNLLVFSCAYTDHEKWKIDFLFSKKRKPYGKSIKDSNFYFSLILLPWESKFLEDQNIKEFKEKTNGKVTLEMHHSNVTAVKKQKQQSLRNQHQFTSEACDRTENSTHFLSQRLVSHPQDQHSSL